jgi:hypothetical protein
LESIWDDRPSRPARRRIGGAFPARTVAGSLREVEDMGHRGWTPQQSMTVLSKAIGFLEGVLK